MPLLAKQADKYAIIRSMTHGNNGHETASYMVQTARAQGGRDVFPSVGAVVSLFKGYQAGYKGLIPPYIVLTEPQGRFSEAGFLGRALQALCHGGRPRPDAGLPWKAWWRQASPTSGSATGASCSTSSTRWSTPCRAMRNWSPPSSARSRPTT